MKLTTKRLYNLIEESMQSKFSPEQEEKVLTLIKTTRDLMFKLEEIDGFFPPMINTLYSYDGEEFEEALRDFTIGPRYKKMINAHYSALARMADILYEVNHYLFLLETLEIVGRPAGIAQGMLYDSVNGVATVNGNIVRFSELDGVIDTAIMFLEDIQELRPKYFGEKDADLESIHEVFKAFMENYSNLKSYLENIK